VGAIRMVPACLRALETPSNVIMDRVFPQGYLNGFASANHDRRSLLDSRVDVIYPKWDNIMARQIKLPGEKPLFWVGSSKSDLLEFSEAVKDEIGVALSVAQFGGKHPSAKPWKGEGSGVLEIVEDYRGNTYRAVYTVKFEKSVYVLHAFQKKSPKGIKTAQPDVELVAKRLKAASEDYEARYGIRKK